MTTLSISDTEQEKRDSILNMEEGLLRMSSVTDTTLGMFTGDTRVYLYWVKNIYLPMSFAKVPNLKLKVFLSPIALTFS